MLLINFLPCICVRIVCPRLHEKVVNFHLFSFLSPSSASKAIDILEAYEGTLEEDYPPDNERCEHGEMLLYKVIRDRYTFICCLKKEK